MGTRLLTRHQERAFEWLHGRPSCHQAERLVSRDLDGQLSRSERNLLRAHLRFCADCVRFERLQIHSRAALRSFELARVPDSLRADSLGRWESSTGETQSSAGRPGRSGKQRPSTRRSSR
ncbi:MAG: anti-sigma factor [Gaiellaceae bacterium]